MGFFSKKKKIERLSWKVFYDRVNNNYIPQNKSEEEIKVGLVRIIKNYRITGVNDCLKVIDVEISRLENIRSRFSDKESIDLSDKISYLKRIGGKVNDLYNKHTLN